MPWPGNEASPWIRIGQRRGRVVDSLARRAVGLLRAGLTLDDRVDRLEVARIRGERHGDLAGGGRAAPLRAEVVLDVAAASLGIGADRLERLLALELAQDRLVGAADDVREDVEPAAVRHAHHDFLRTGARTELDRLVEHRHHHVEALDRELLLPEERAAEVALHPLDLGEARQQQALLVVRERRAVAARLDRLAQPDALLVVGDVLDLVRAGAAVGRAEERQRVGQRLAGDVEAQQRGRDTRLQLGREGRDEPLRLQSGVAGRLRAERIEVRGEMAVHPVRLDERHRGGDAAEEQIVGCCSASAGLAAGSGLGAATGAPFPLSAEALEQPRETRQRGDERAFSALEELAPFGGHRFGVLEVLLEQRARVARVQRVDIVFHVPFVAAGTTRVGGRRTTAIVIPITKAAPPTATAIAGRRVFRPAIAVESSASTIDTRTSRSGWKTTEARLVKMDTAARKPLMTSPGLCRSPGTALTIHASPSPRGSADRRRAEVRAAARHGTAADGACVATRSRREQDRAEERAAQRPRAASARP